MSPESMKIALAELRGWRYQKRVSFAKAETLGRAYQGEGVYTPSGDIARFYDSRGNDYQNLSWECCFQRKLIADCLKDLNAIHDLENLLDGYMMLKYTTILRDVVGGEGGSFSHIHASAAQRGEALLKTFGKWID